MTTDICQISFSFFLTCTYSATLTSNNLPDIPQKKHTYSILIYVYIAGFLWHSMIIKSLLLLNIYTQKYVIARQYDILIHFSFYDPHVTMNLNYSHQCSNIRIIGIAHVQISELWRMIYLHDTFYHYFYLLYFVSDVSSYKN